MVTQRPIWVPQVGLGTVWVLPVELLTPNPEFFWSRRWESDRQPAIYKTGPLRLSASTGVHQTQKIAGIGGLFVHRRSSASGSVGVNIGVKDSPHATYGYDVV